MKIYKIKDKTIKGGIERSDNLKMFDRVFFFINFNSERLV
ncbi:hypothetical protein YPPY13_1894 [Yersinia pestis PY-13]|uniref:Uncharacterized protein n=1 Tax=Yersinia pestis biovar Orientalis str. IP275 TaxID=373665 RepID=A0AAV3B7T9_YERPE|nr:hypothetical protein YPIP275_0465 [Yersinia pestis biovar Orientalis str. IP275]EDR39866.1 hypothetical protein YpF1991016_1749 [Yersinia pestis biovar Orientalis str. F1991016]EDR44296.1 hypothetical protein YpE1979001_0663 [Yersinia pestis biovar Antiqua str. E1979001]EDR56311.1 hypothetical protein YpMG051020_1739 [Yersinia pestis biovar Orientalis str. MG05-1020]EDR61708.1 hypothetical protein YpUG050454_2130 [Yersinia pestis biovar Antiqua str. UG05-0454]EFA46023.1 hypothetical protein